MFSIITTPISALETMPEQTENKKDKNMKEWNRINNIWLDIKNKNKVENPSLYSTDSENSAENLADNTSPIFNIKKSNSFCSYDDEISNNNEFVDMTYHDSVYDEYKLGADTYANTYGITPSSVKCKYTTDNAASLELDYTLNYNMKMLTHYGNYYEILKSKHSGVGTLTLTKTKTKTKSKTQNNATKLCKPELIKSIVAFETNEMNHHVVYKCKKMLEYIENIKKDKYFASFVIFP